MPTASDQILAVGMALGMRLPVTGTQTFRCTHSSHLMYHRKGLPLVESKNCCSSPDLFSAANKYRYIGSSVYQWGTNLCI